MSICNAHEALMAYARMMNTLDVTKLEPYLAEDVRYTSQWVLAAIESKNEYVAYIAGKLDTIKRSGQRVWAQVGTLTTYPHGECVVLAQNEPDNYVATVLIEIAGDKITRINMCAVPEPKFVKVNGNYPQ